MVDKSLINNDLAEKKFGIDTSNVLYSSGSYKNSTKSYTATEDCVVCCIGAYVDQMIFTGFIDGVEVFRYGTYASALSSPTPFNYAGEARIATGNIIDSVTPIVEDGNWVAIACKAKNDETLFYCYANGSGTIARRVIYHRP